MHVHNHVAPRMIIGDDGFRARVQCPTDDLVECGCNWHEMDLHGERLRGVNHYRAMLTEQ